MKPLVALASQETGRRTTESGISNIQLVFLNLCVAANVQFFFVTSQLLMALAERGHKQKLARYFGTGEVS